MAAEFIHSVCGYFPPQTGAYTGYTAHNAENWSGLCQFTSKSGPRPRNRGVLRFRLGKRDVMYLARRTWSQDLKLALSVFAFVSLLIGVTLVGLLWNNPRNQATGQEPVQIISDANFDDVFRGQPNADWQKLLYRITVVDFCGELTWHVREGYRIDRNQLQINQPISIADASTLRNRAISMVEEQMNRDGVQDYSFWCSEQGEAAALYFRTVWFQSASLS